MVLSISEQMQYITARIEVELKEGGISTGTGYILNLCSNETKHIPVLVTNKHVVEDGKVGRFKMTVALDDDTPDDTKHIDIIVKDIGDKFIYHPEIDIDLAILPIGHYLNKIEKNNVKLFFKAIDITLLPTDLDISQFTAVEDIIMVGYPNGIWDSVNNLPVFRKGITATHPSKKYNGKEEFMIDAACFPGSSGSPVFLYNNGGYTTKEGKRMVGTRVKFLGTLYAGPQHTASGKIEVVKVPTKDVPVAVSLIPNNLGYVIKAKKLLDFEDILNERFQLS